jgi:hypothetical protein
MLCRTLPEYRPVVPTNQSTAQKNPGKTETMDPVVDDGNLAFTSSVNKMLLAGSAAPLKAGAARVTRSWPTPGCPLYEKNSSAGAGW